MVLVGRNSRAPRSSTLVSRRAVSLFVDLEAVGLLSVDAAPEVAASIVRCAAASLAVSPFAESSRMFTVGLEPRDATSASASVESHESLSAAVDAVRVTVGSITTATSGDHHDLCVARRRHTAARRGNRRCCSLSARAIRRIWHCWRRLQAAAVRGVGVMIDRPVVGQRRRVACRRRSTSCSSPSDDVSRRSVCRPSRWSAVDDLLDAAERHCRWQTAVHVVPLVGSGRPVQRPQPDDSSSTCLGNVVGANGRWTARRLRSVQVAGVGGVAQPASPSPRQRASARTALWDVAVRDATFSNVVSDARRAMAKGRHATAGARVARQDDERGPAAPRSRRQRLSNCWPTELPQRAVSTRRSDRRAASWHRTDSRPAVRRHRHICGQTPRGSRRRWFC